MAYIESIQSMSTFKSDVEVTEEDKVVSLSTCTYEINDGRYVVVGKLTQIH
jgi:sortase B